MLLEHVASPSRVEERVEKVVQLVVQTGRSRYAFASPLHYARMPSLDDLGCCTRKQQSGSAECHLCQEGSAADGRLCPPAALPVRPTKGRLTQADNLAPPTTPQFCRHDAANPVPDHLLLVVDQDGRIVVKADVPAVWPARRVLCAHDDGATDVAAADFGRRRRGRGAGAGKGVRSRALDNDDDLVTW